MDINSVKFVKSSADFKSCPSEGLPEFAFAGRSNAGKSSLLNLLVNIKNLAKTSSTPGKTRLINHYLINESWYLVDLPGYGYARAGKKDRDFYTLTVANYLLNRKSLSCLFVLIDSRHKPLENDLRFIDWIGSAEIPLALVFTKTDKLTATSLKHNTEIYKKTLLETWEELPPFFTSSSVMRTGREEILSFIEKSM